MSKGCFCGSGRKVKKCHPNVSRDSKMASILRSMSDFDNYIDDHQLKAQCPTNCNICCNDLFFIDEMEFLTILNYIERKKTKLTLEDYVERATIIYKYMEENYPGIIEVLRSKMPPSLPENVDMRYFDDNFVWDHTQSCIFLSDGKCDIYKVRPYVCRSYGTTKTCDQVIKNEEVNLEVDEQLQYHTSMILSENKEFMQRRPYPIFYFFSRMMTVERLRNNELNRKKELASSTESEYYDYLIKRI